VEVIIEAAGDDLFYLVGDRAGKVHVRTRRPSGNVDIFMRLPAGSIRNILEGAETPVEAFFLGHLRARGHTRDLYTLHAFFLALAEIAVASPDIQKVVEAFQAEKEES
jgi:hypothetical protein